MAETVRWQRLMTQSGLQYQANASLFLQIPEPQTNDVDTAQTRRSLKPVKSRLRWVDFAGARDCANTNRLFCLSFPLALSLVRFFSLSNACNETRCGPWATGSLTAHCTGPHTCGQGGPHASQHWTGPRYSLTRQVALGRRIFNFVLMPD